MTKQQPTFRNAMSRVRHLGPAHRGTEHSWAMRVGSTALTLLTLGGVWLAFSLAGAPHERVRDLFSHRVMPATILVLLLGVSIHHMKLGMQNIIEDYVHDDLAKSASLFANTSFCALMAVASAIAVLKLCVG